MKLVFSFLSRFFSKKNILTLPSSPSAHWGGLCLCLPSPCSALSVLLPLWTHARNMCPCQLGKTTTLWLWLWGAGYGVARRRQTGQFPGQVGGVVGWWERPHLLPARRTHTHTFPIRPETLPFTSTTPFLCHSLLTHTHTHTHLRTHLHFWFHRFRCSFLKEKKTKKTHAREQNCTSVVNRFK